MPFCSLDSFLPLMNGTQVMVHVMAAKSAPEISEAVWLPSNACDHKEWRLTAASKEKPSFLLDPFSWQNDWLYLWTPNLSKLKVIHQTQSRQNEILPPFYSDIESFLSWDILHTLYLKHKSPSANLQHAQNCFYMLFCILLLFWAGINILARKCKGMRMSKSCERKSCFDIIHGSQRSAFLASRYCQTKHSLLVYSINQDRS